MTEAARPRSIVPGGIGWQAGVDPEVPNAARIYDYLLGGCRNFAADRRVADTAREQVPDLAEQAWTNRDFLRRAVHHLAGLGVRQFLDIGSGIPTVGSVHEIVHRVDPEARVVYVDNDPTAVAHSRLLLEGDPRVCVGSRHLIWSVSTAVYAALIQRETPSGL
jgi:hypothetical protein